LKKLEIVDRGKRGANEFVNIASQFAGSPEIAEAARGLAREPQRARLGARED
jgi:hypothetical protein